MVPGKYNTFVFHHDNETSPRADIQEFLIKHSTNTAPQTPHSTFMAPCDYLLFPHFKLSFLGHRFQFNLIKENSLQTLKGIHKNNFRAGFDDWNKSLQKCIEVGEEHFEGDEINFD